MKTCGHVLIILVRVIECCQVCAHQPQGGIISLSRYFQQETPEYSVSVHNAVTTVRWRLSLRQPVRGIVDKLLEGSRALDNRHKQSPTDDEKEEDEDDDRGMACQKRGRAHHVSDCMT